MRTKILLPLLALALVAVVPTAHAQFVVGSGTWSPVGTPDSDGSPFWDQESTDDFGSPVTDYCNIGYFAVGGFGTNCLNQASGTSANAGLFPGASFLHDGSNGPIGYLFDGKFSYNLKLLGVLSETDLGHIGFFRYDGASYYGFTTIADFVSKSVNSTYRVGAGDNWGFFYSDSPVNGDPIAQCDGSTTPSRFCSDWSYITDPAKERIYWSLFRAKTTSAKMLVGMEDRRIPFGDSDYNDWMIGVTASPEPASMALMATGLLGLVGAGYVRRRRK